MSADVQLVIDTGGDEPHEIEGTHENITYNLTKMLSEAGFPGHRAMVGAPATEAGGVYRRTADRLLSDRAHFEQWNPENGWGDYDLAVQFCQAMARHCASHPKGTIDAWL